MSETGVRDADDPTEATWAMVAHLSMILGPVSWVASLAILLTVGSRSPFVADQAREALNFQITMGLGIVACLALLLVLVGGLLLVLWVLLGIGLAVAAATTAYDGRAYRYPVCMRLI